MAKKQSIFQIVLMGIFAFFIVVAVFIFAGLGNIGTEQSIGTVTLWGTYNQDMMDEYITILNETDETAGNIKYEYIPEDNFHDELVEALANGTGPDLFIIDQSYILRHWNKIAPISYDNITRRDFMNTFIEESELFLSDSGIIGMPFALDPMVMYWNRDIFAQKGFAKPPAYWDDIIFMAEKITDKDEAGNIEIATLAFGTFNNISHAKDILSTLILQKGGEVVGRDKNGKLYSALGFQDEFGGDLAQAQTAVRSYTEFANPIKTIYTWNRSLPNSIDMFAQGRLAMYIGYASELTSIQARNPNLNFDIAVLPQIRSGEDKRILTFGNMDVLAVSRQAQNPYGANAIANFLAGAFPSAYFSSINNSTSPRRDLLAEPSNDVLREIFRSSALISRAWLDPRPSETDRIFENMIESTISGRLRFSDAVSRADTELNALIQELLQK